MARQRAARALTELGAPVVTLVALPVVVGVHAGGAGLAAGLVAAVFFGLAPFGYVLHGARAGHWTDRHVRRREQRKPVFLFTLASMLTGLGALHVAGAPRTLTGFLLTLLVQAGAALAVTLRWKISLHAWVSAIGATTLVLILGAAAALLWPVLAAVGWSRVELQDHTVAQVAAGTAAGTLLTILLLPVLG